MSWGSKIFHFPLCLILTENCSFKSNIHSCLLLHNNISKAERKALKSLKEDDPRLIMKADKGNCFVFMDRSDYNEKMEASLSDHLTNQLVQKSPFAKIER